MSEEAQHVATVRIEGREIVECESYQISSDMLSPADDFSLTIAPCTADLFKLTQPDSAVEVFVDGVRILRGFIGERVRRKNAQRSELQVSGRDRAGRLLDESMPLETGIRGLTLEQLAQRVAGPWFESVTFNNAANRVQLRAARAKHAAAWNEPGSETEAVAKKENLARYSSRKLGDTRGAQKMPRKVQPGQSRWQVLSRALEPARFLAWSTADGKSLVIGVPNYDQSPQYRFVVPADSASSIKGYANVIEWEHVSSTEDRYSEIQIVGESRGDSSTYGSAITRSGSAKADDFKYDKKLIVQNDDVHSSDHAVALAQREMAVRDKSRDVIKATVDGHSQRYRGQGIPAMYAFDTVCEVLDEECGVKGLWYITGVEFSGSKNEGAMTHLTMLPLGTELSP